MRRLIIVLVFVCVILPLVILLNADMMMWEVENGSNKVYLMGSIHVMPEDVYPLDEQIESAFENSDVLVVELDATTMDMEKVNAAIVQTAFYPEGSTLKEKISEELFNSVAVKIAELGVTETQLNSFRPWFVAMNLGLGALQKLEIKAGLGIDMHFLNKAHERQLSIIELENVTSQLEALASMSDSTQIDYLQYTLDDYDKVNEVFSEMLAAWRVGDAGKLNEMTRLKLQNMEDELPGMEEYYNRILPERDKKILLQLKELLENEEKHTYFVVVGALHLVGSDGLLQLLNDNGYETKQF